MADEQQKVEKEQAKDDEQEQGRADNRARAGERRTRIPALSHVVDGVTDLADLLDVLHTAGLHQPVYHERSRPARRDLPRRSV